MSEPHDDEPVDLRTLVASARERGELTQEQADETSRQRLEVIEGELAQLERSGSPSVGAIRFLAENWDAFLAQNLDSIRVTAEELANSVGLIERAPSANEVAMVAKDQAQWLASASLYLRVLASAARLKAAVEDAQGIHD